MENFKFSVPTKVAIQFKIKLRLSKSKYNSLRTTLEDYIRLPCYDTLMAEAKFMMPTKEDPLDFKLQGEVVGSYWPPLKVAQDAIVDILEVTVLTNKLILIFVLTDGLKFFWTIISFTAILHVV